jgi:hypothetical protein
MKKKVISIILVIICLILTCSVSYAKSTYYADLSTCKNVCSESNDCGAFMYGFNGKTLYSSMLLPSQYNRNVTIDYDIRSVCQSGNVTYALYDINRKSSQFGIVGMNMTNGSCNYYEFSGVNLANTDSFSVSDGYAYFVRSDDTYSYVAIYNLDGNFKKKWTFSGNVNLLFNNNGNTYALLYDGSIYRFSKTNCEYVNSIKENSTCFNAGANWVCSSNGELVSLNSNTVNSLTTYSTNCVAKDDNGVYTKSGRSVYLTFNNGEVKSYTVDNEISRILVSNNKTAVVYSDWSYDVISLKEYSSSKSYDNSIKISLPNSYSINSDGILIGVESGTSVSDFKSKFSNLVTVYDSNSSVVTSGKMKSGYYVSYFDSTYSVAVRGDITGEGNVKSNDTNMLISYFLEITTFDKLQLASADYNMDGRVSNADLVLIDKKANG